MKKVALITGITGQDGAYLATLLLKKNYQVIGITRGAPFEDLWRLNYFGITKKITFIKGSVLDQDFVSKILKKYQPTELYNLVGQSSVARSWERPRETQEINFGAVIVMLEAIRTVSPKTKFFQASSAEIYGQTKGVLTEKNTTFNPLNPYAVSKAAAHQSVDLYRDHFGLFAVNGILFNHESPLREDFFVTKKIVQGVAAIARGELKSISLGNLNSKRDFGYAADFVEAMWRLLQLAKPRNMVICTGYSYSIAQFVAAALAEIGIKKWRQYVTIDQSLVRKKEVKAMRGDHRALTKVTGWKPSVSFAGLVKLMVDFELRK